MSKPLLKLLPAVITLLIIVFFYTGNDTSSASAQVPGDIRIDSLLASLNTTKEDTNKVLLLLDIADEYIRFNPDEALKYGEQALLLADKLKYQYGIMKSNNALGLASRAKSNYSKALEYFSKSLLHAEKEGNKISIGICHANLSIIYRKLADYPSSLEHILKALKIAEDTGNKLWRGRYLGTTGQVYLALENYTKALEYYQESSRISEELGDHDQIIGNLLNTAIIYAYLSDYPKAIENNLKCLKIAEESGYTTQVQVILGNLGAYYSKLNDREKGFFYYRKSLQIAREIGNSSAIGVNLANIGSEYFIMATDSAINDIEEKNRYLTLAVEHIEQAIPLFEEAGDIDSKMNYLNVLSDLYQLLGNWKKALDNYKTHKSLSDSIYSGENKKKIANLEAKRENEIKQKEIEILQQKNQIQGLDLTCQQQAMALLHGKQKLQSLELEKKSNDMTLMQKEKDVTSLELKQKNLEAEKKDKEVVLLNKEKAYQSIVSRSLTGGLVFTGAIIVLLFLFFQRKRRDNKILGEKNLIIEQSNSELYMMNQNLSAKNFQIIQQKDLIEKSHEVIQEGVDQAKEYVLSLLPPKINTGPMQADWLFLPSSQLGGDAFGYHQIDNDHYAFYILDVCGHGIGAALHSVAILHFIRSGSQLNVDLRKPEQVLESLNNTFQSDVHNGLFFTMWYGVLNITDHSLTYVCAGHPAPILLSDDGKYTLLDPPSMSVGCIENISYKPQKIAVPRKAKLFLFSDGTYEVRKPGGITMLVEDFYDIIRKYGSNGTGLQPVFDKVAGIQESLVFEDDFSILKVTLEL